MTASTSVRRSTPVRSTTKADSLIAQPSSNKCNGTKRGSVTETPLTIARNDIAKAAQAEGNALAALKRLSERYTVAVNRSLGIAPKGSPDRHDAYDHFRIPMPVADRQRLGDWFVARYNYLQEIYRQAINANESIIAGRQQIFDSRPRLFDVERDQ